MSSYTNSQTDLHCSAICGWVERLLRQKIERFRAARDRAPAEFLGLHITDSDVDSLLASENVGGDDTRSLLSEELEWCGRFPESRITRFATRFGLSDFERQAVEIALAPELDLRFQSLFAYVQNDVTRKLPTVDLILELLSPAREQRWDNRRLFFGEAALLRNSLIQLPDESAERELSCLASAVKVARRVTQFVLGSESIDTDLGDVASLLACDAGPEELDLATVEAERLWRIVPLLDHGGVLTLRGQHGAGKLKAAQAICNQLGRPLLVCDLRAKFAFERASGRLLRRECILLNAGLYLKLAAHSGEEKFHAAREHSLAAQSFPIFVSLEDLNVPALDFKNDHLYRLEFELPGIAGRRAIWQRELSECSNHGLRSELDILAAEYRFTPGQICEVIREARNIAQLRADDRAVHATDVRKAVNRLCSSQISGLAQHVELLFTWEDLVLPPRVLQQLQEVEATVRYRHIVQTRWGFDTKTGKHAGISTLFSGVSGTGKTMAAGVLARSLGLELYRIDLSRIVSKFVGETEQNLRRIFEEAESCNAMLFFDEADALFGKRSEVKDAQDRYANIEVAYLLQRMETFCGVCILATNLSRNIDSAFVRRMHHVIEFPFPEAPYRERIWRRMFPAQAPMGDDVDFEFLSRQFELSGGNIRNVVIAAAFLAAQREQPVSMEHLVQATGREMQKMGKLPSKAEFQGHFEVISRLHGDR